MPSGQSIVELIRSLYGRITIPTDERHVEEDKKEALDRGVDPVPCSQIRYKDIFFDYDDTLIGGWKYVDRSDTFQTLNNLSKTREVCGYPRLHVVSFNSQFSLDKSMKRNKLTEYFDTINATGSDKSKAITDVLKEFGGTPEKSVMIGHDINYDFLPIRANPETRQVNSRLISDRLSAYDQALVQEEKDRLKGFCFLKSIGWKDIKPIVDGSDGCKEDIDQSEDTADKISFENLFGGAITFPKLRYTKPEETYEDVWGEYDKKYGKEVREWR